MKYVYIILVFVFSSLIVLLFAFLFVIVKMFINSVVEVGIDIVFVIVVNIGDDMFNIDETSVIIIISSINSGLSGVIVIFSKIVSIFAITITSIDIRIVNVFGIPKVLIIVTLLVVFELYYNGFCW